MRSSNNCSVTLARRQQADYQAVLDLKSGVSLTPHAVLCFPSFPHQRESSNSIRKSQGGIPLLVERGFWVQGSEKAGSGFFRVRTTPRQPDRTTWMKRGLALLAAEEWQKALTSWRQRDRPWRTRGFLNDYLAVR